MGMVSHIPEILTRASVKTRFVCERPWASLASPRPGPQRRTRAQRPWPHPKPRANRRRHRLQHASARGAMLEPRVGPGEVRAQPVSTRGTLRIDALHGPAGQILHGAPLRSRLLGRTDLRFGRKPKPPRRQSLRERTAFSRRLPVVSSRIPTTSWGRVAGHRCRIRLPLPRNRSACRIPARR